MHCNKNHGKRPLWAPIDLHTKKISPFWTGCPCQRRENWAGSSGAGVDIEDWALYSVWCLCLKSGLSAPIDALLKSLCAGNMNNFRNLFLKDGQPQKNIYILLFLFTEKVVVLFASSAFLKMSLRTTIFLGDFFGPLTWCSRVLRFSHLSCTSTGPSVIGPRPRRVSSFTIFFFPPASLPPSSPPPRPFSSSSGQLSHSPARDNKKCHQTDKRNFPQTTHYFWNEREP